MLWPSPKRAAVDSATCCHFAGESDQQPAVALGEPGRVGADELPETAQALVAEETRGFGDFASGLSHQDRDVHFQGMSETPQRFHGWRRMTVFDSGEVAPQKAGPFLNVPLRKALFDAKKFQCPTDGLFQ